MALTREKRKQLAKTLLSKRRLVLLNENTFEETFSLRLTWMNVFLVATLGAVVIIFCTTLLIAFTPLREYIPGYTSDKLRREATLLAIKTDSLQQQLAYNDAFLQGIQQALTGQVELLEQSKDSIVKTGEMIPTEKLNTTEVEKKLRDWVDKEDKYNVSQAGQVVKNLVFYSPVFGQVTSSFDLQSNQWGVRLAVEANQPVKAVLSGNVLLAGWTPDYGNILVIRHAEGYTSMYKNDFIPTKKIGDRVLSGEVVGIILNSEKGAKLTFELWKEGVAVDPLQFVDFK